MRAYRRLCTFYMKVVCVAGVRSTRTFIVFAVQHTHGTFFRRSSGFACKQNNEQQNQEKEKEICVKVRVEFYKTDFP